MTSQPFDSFTARRHNAGIDRTQSLTRAEDEAPPRPASTPLAVALYYHSHGFNPLPLCGPACGCQSPGKVPHIRDWANLYSNGPVPRSAVDALFRHHKGNIGIAIPAGIMVLDIDPRSGGGESFESMTLLNGTLPDTPASTTGGGGKHFFLSLPAGLSVGAGGSLNDVGFNGVEWKSKGGQVVEAPSIHPSGNSYVWDVEYELGQVPIAAAPQWLIDLILQAKDSPGQTRDRMASRGGAPKAKAYSATDIRYFFGKRYEEGSRRTGTGLPRLVGILANRRVPEDRAIDFLVHWQNDHFIPTFDPDYLAMQIHTMYLRFAGDKMSDPVEGERFLKNLWRDMSNPRPAAPPVATTADGDVLAQATEVVKEMTLREQRNEALLAARAKAWAPEAIEERRNRLIAGWVNREVRTMPTEDGIHLPIYTCGVDIIPLDKQELVELLQIYEKPGGHVIERAIKCMQRAVWRCFQHGRKGGPTTTICRNPMHYWCATSTSSKVRQLELPTLSDGAAYRTLVLQWEVRPEGDIQDMDAQFKNEIADAKLQIDKLRSRREVKGLLQAWSLAAGLARPVSVMELRLLFMGEGTEEAAAKVAEVLERRLGAKVVWADSYQDGEKAVVQLYEWSTHTLIGMRDSQDTELFAAYYYAQKGTKMFHGVAALYKMLAEIKKEEAPRCDECGRPLRLVPEVAPERSDSGADGGKIVTPRLLQTAIPMPF